MQTTRPPTHRLRFSPPQPAAFGLSVTDHQEALHELLSYISVPPNSSTARGQVSPTGAQRQR